MLFKKVRKALRSGLFFVLDAACPICRDSVVQEPLCLSCKSKIEKSVLNAGSIETFSSLKLTPEVRGLLHSIKYEFKYEYLQLFEPYLPSQFYWNPSSKATVVPVPLSFQRFKKRGFNQSEWLARKLAKNWGLRLETRGLIKVKETQAQSLLDKNERKTNLNEAFDWISSIEIPENVLLVDDVLTTGQTLKECMSTLKKAGTKEVKCWTLARAEGPII